MSVSKTSVVALVARHILTAAGAVLVTHGYVDESTVQEIVGALSTAVGLIWSYYNKKGETV